jgi:tRNA(Arg) A34 adenosine deaminase TadA
LSPGSAGAASSPRRGVLALGLSLAVGPGLCHARECDVCSVDERTASEFEFTQPAVPSAAAFMAVARQAKAFAEKRGDSGFGAALVVNALVAGAAPNRTRSGHDPTAHAEIEAIRDACRRLAANRVDNAVLYATSRPCRMCELACYHAGVAKIVYGDSLTDAGSPRNEAC